ncbi:hypothetical protein [Mesorhizobium sp. WSM4313]|uniref:hypothetical protein n=1 Tax=Mesorhizobium sp. WSM4313 TaxID=2029412 RepID=UPI000BB0C67D|nr:hypothetical protein [Mesorhizobium sp. WSM4313]PBB21147.1 hypothetical protein CK219_00465 [Mesorhizobium sp. WSM4313]
MIGEPVDALAFARSVIHRYQIEEIDVAFGIRVNWLRKAGNRRFVVELVKQFCQWRVENLMHIVDLARAGWGVADEALRSLMLEYQNRGEVMPTYLAAYSMEIISGRIPKIRGKQKADYFLRDMAVLCTIIMVMEKFELAATSRDGKNICACLVVADAMAAENQAIGYKAVAEIWRKYGHAAARDVPGQAVLK